MKFKDIEIHHFRGFKHLKVEDFRQVNLLVGKNNSGKTSVLEALFLTVGMSNPRLVLSLNNFRNLHTLRDEFRYIFYQLDYSNQPQILANFDKNDHQRDLKIKVEQRPAENRATNISTDTSSNSQELYDLIFDFHINDAQQAQSHSVKLGVLAEYKERLQASFNSPFLQDETYHRLDKRIRFKERKDIVETLQEIDPNIQDITLGANEVIYVDIEADQLIPINLLGDGINRILSILVNIADVKQGFLMIDEVNMGLHFSALETLWEAIFRAAHKFEVQVFATTHTDECVRAYLKTHHKLYDHTLDNSRLYRIEKREDQHEAVCYDIEDIETTLENNWEYR